MNQKIVLRIAVVTVGVLFIFPTLFSCEKEALRVSQTSPKRITKFALYKANNSMLAKDIVADISEGNGTVSLEVPYGVPLRNLVPTIELSSGASISPKSGEANDFRAQTIYVVTGPDKTKTSFRVVTKIEAKPATPSDDVSLSVKYGSNTLLAASKDQTSFPLVLPSGTNLSKVIVNLTVASGAKVNRGQKKLVEVVAESGNLIDTVDFSAQSSAVFTVTAEDGTSKQDYTVTASQRTNASKDILSFAFLSQEAWGVIDNTAHTIAVALPAGTDPTSLQPTIIHTGESIFPKSGATYDFSQPRIYTVTATDNTILQYTVSVTYNKYMGNGLSVSYIYNQTQKTGAPKPSDEQKPIDINGKLYVVLPLDADGDANIKLNLTVSEQASLVEGTAPIALTKNAVTQNFSIPDAGSQRTFTVTSQNGVAKNYVVNFVKTTKATKSIVAFYLTGKDNPSFFDDGLVVQGVIDEANHKILVTLPDFANTAQFKPSILHTGASVTPESLKSQDFRAQIRDSKPIKYEVTAGDKYKQEYTVEIRESSKALRVVSYE